MRLVPGIYMPFISPYTPKELDEESKLKYSTLLNMIRRWDFSDDGPRPSHIFVLRVIEDEF